MIQVQRQRYLCRDCRASCSQQLLDVDKRRNMTRRLVEYIQRRSVSTRRTFISIAEEVGLDPRSIHNIFNEHIDQLDAARCIETPAILGIDELHVLGAPRAIFTNLEANTIIELLDNRRKSSVIQYLRQLKSPERIRTVVSVISDDGVPSFLASGDAGCVARAQGFPILKSSSVKWLFMQAPIFLKRFFGTFLGWGKGYERLVLPKTYSL